VSGFKLKLGSPALSRTDGHSVAIYLRRANCTLLYIVVHHCHHCPLISGCASSFCSLLCQPELLSAW